MKQVLRHFARFFKKTDFFLLAVCMTCSATSAILLWGIHLSGYVSLRTFLVQVIASAIGVVLACIVSMFDYRTLASFWKLYIPICTFLIFLTYFIGIQRVSYVDDKAWLPIPFTSLTFQPSELLKLSFLLFFSLYLERVHEQLNEIQNLATACLLGAVPTLMVAFQGDHGSAIVFIAIFCFMMYAAGINLRYVLVSIASLVALIPFVWMFLLDDNKRRRIMSVYDPGFDPLGTGWQQSLALTAIGSGMVWGKGIFAGNHQYIPEMYNDFIFAFAGEALGFAGSAAILFLLGLLMTGILLNARKSKDLMGKYICVGVFGIIMFQTVCSIGMCLSLLPVIGITLPLFSAGGTSVLATYAGIGLVMSVHRHSYTGLFDERR